MYVLDWSDLWIWSFGYVGVVQKTKRSAVVWHFATSKNIFPPLFDCRKFLATLPSVFVSRILSQDFLQCTIHKNIYRFLSQLWVMDFHCLLYRKQNKNNIFILMRKMKFQHQSLILCLKPGILFQVNRQIESEGVNVIENVKMAWSHETRFLWRLRRRLMSSFKFQDVEIACFTSS